MTGVEKPEMKITSFTQNVIPVYSSSGEQLDEILLPEAIRPVFRRRGGYAASGLYYKGSGIIYSGHTSNQILPGMLKTGENTAAYPGNAPIYQKYQVLYPRLYGKFGIFTFQHQPIFSDFEGGCGPKEANLAHMQRRFFYSAIEGDIQTLPTPVPGHQIYVYRHREVQGNYGDTLRLIEYVLSEGFNCPWDKNIWGDICCYGYVRDLADWFFSKDMCHRLGTAYAFLTSILAADKYLYFYVHSNIIHKGSGMKTT